MDLASRPCFFEQLPSEILAYIFNLLDGISQYMLRRVNTRWNQVLRSHPVTRFTTLVQLEAQDEGDETNPNTIKRCLQMASQETINLIIMAFVKRWLCLHVDKYWPNVRTLALCNVAISTMNLPTGPNDPWTVWINEHHHLGADATLKHYRNPFTWFVTPKMSWIVLNDVDVQSVGIWTLPWYDYIARSHKNVRSEPNPYNGGKITPFVTSTASPGSLVTISRAMFAIRPHENSVFDFFDLLEENCAPVTVAERLEFVHLITELKCPQIDSCKEFMLTYFKRFDPRYMDATWDKVIHSMTGCKVIVFLCMRTIICDLLRSFGSLDKFFCCSLAEKAYERRGSVYGYHPTTYDEAIAEHCKVKPP